MVKFLTGDLRSLLKAAINNSKSLKATTAFWTIGFEYFKNTTDCGKFIDLLSKEDSFFVVDISIPTLIDNVVGFSANGANMRFYLKRAKDNLLKYDHLLHSKIFLFENAHDNDFTLIIGSANMTGRALKGTNREAGVSINLTREDVLYGEVLDYLNNIKRESIAVDSTKIDRYKFIQDQSNLESLFNSCPILYIISNPNEFNQAGGAEIIQLLGLNDETFKFFDKIQSLNNQIALLIENRATNETKICVCNVLSVGEIKTNENKTYEKHHEKRMHFYLGLSKISGASTPAFLFPEEEITQQMFYISDFHAELKITQIYKFAYEKNEVLKERLNPWKEIKVIEDYTTNIPEKNSIKLDYSEKGTFYNASEIKTKPNRIRIEEIKADFLTDKFYEAIKKITKDKDSFMDKVEPIPVNSNYIDVIKEIKEIISSVKFDNHSRELLRSKIDEKLKDNYSKRKQSKEAPRQNIKLFDSHLVFVSDEIHDK